MYFDGDTVKSDCPIQIFRKMIKYLQTVGLPTTSFTVSGDIYKKAENLKKSSGNDQLTGPFQSFFILFFFRPPP